MVILDILSYLISKQGIKVVGYDINRKLVNKLNSLKNKQNKYLSFTHNINTIKKIDIILISLPTPLTKNFEPDLSYIQNFLNSCSKILKKIK